MSARVAAGGHERRPSAHPGADGLVGAAWRALRAMAAEPGGAVVVAGRDDGPGSLTAVPGRAWPHVVAPGAATRMAVGEGAALAGRPAVVVCEHPGDVRAARWEAGRLVALTCSQAVAQAAWEAGVPVAAPAWAADVEPLLRDAAARGRACVWLHGESVAPAPPLALEQPCMLAPRTVAHGEAGRVAAAGALVPPLLEAAWFLARAGRPITVQQQTCLDADGFDPLTAGGHLRRDLGDRWEDVPVVSAQPRALARDLAARLGDRG